MTCMEFCNDIDVIKMKWAHQMDPGDGEKHWGDGMTPKRSVGLMNGRVTVVGHGKTKNTPSGHKKKGKSGDAGFKGSH